MTTELQYALMAGGAYLSTRGTINRFPIPAGWAQLGTSRDDNSGFEAVAFQQGVNPSNIVISFAGTNFGAADLAADAALGSGIAWSAQLGQAAAFYLGIRQTYPNATISFTGHSLGGGLAALLAVFFDEPAMTFDQAPFALSLGMRDTLIAHLKVDYGYTDQQLLALAPSLVDPLTPGNGATNVTDISVAGQLLATFPYSLLSTIGTEQPPMANGSEGVSATDLHSQALLTLFVMSDPFRQATIKLTDLEKMLFDSNLYAFPTDADKGVENFLERLIKHQAGITDVITPNAMLTRFTSDLWKLAQSGGLTMSEGTNYYGNLDNVSNTLIAFAMQKYYEENNPNITYGTELFTDLTAAGTGSNGLRFDMSGVSITFATAFANNQKLNLSDAKGFDLYFKNYIGYSGYFTQFERQLIQSILPYLRDWYVQAGASGMNATDTLNRGAFMLGGSGSDALVGGTGADLLVGNAGDDLLQGKEGNDILLGGTGNDFYIYTTGDGLDTIYDNGGQGSIVMDGNTLHGGAQYGDTHVHRDANKHLYVDVGNGRMVIDGNILIEDQQTGELGLTAMSGPAADVDPVTTTTTLQLADLTDAEKISKSSTLVNFHLGNEYDDGTYERAYLPNSGWGSYKFGDAGANDPDYHPYIIDNHPVYGSAARGEPLSTASDHVIGSGSDDFIYFAGDGGNDLIEAGAGHDTVYGGVGDDVISGGTDSDILSGSIGNDRLYADAQISVTDAIAAGNLKNTGTGIRGDWLAGGEGEDTLVGSTGNDVLTGGNGSDLLIGGAGDDDILGDAAWVARIFEWTATDLPDGTRLLYGVEDDTQPAVGAADVIYAGAGNDHVFGGLGNDVIFGEGGDDRLTGEGGNDTILGGAGKDHIWGDDGNSTDATSGNDYLDGGEGDDVIHGNEGDDIIIGGKGVDTLYGNEGQDIYIFNRGDGRDTVFDTLADNNILRFGAGISSADITLNLGSLLINLGGGDEIHIDGFDRNDVFNSSSIGGFDRMRAAMNDENYNTLFEREAA